MMLSVIIPAYKQEKTIIEDLGHIQDVLSKLRYEYEMIVVVDGELDSTKEKAEEYRRSFSKDSSRVQVLVYAVNRGKGFAVRYGMSKAKGEYIAFLDSGMDLNPNGLSLLLEHMEWYKADIVVGSKRHPASKVHYPFIRRLYSWGYQIFVKLLFGLTITDTQTGLKIFRREVLQDVMPRLLIKRWAFDIEMLAVAYYLGYTRIYEAPVELTHNFSSSINRRAVWNMLWDTSAVFYRMHILHYYDESNRELWMGNEYGI